MNYATVQDMTDRYGEPEMIQITDPDIVAVQAPTVVDAPYVARLGGLIPLPHINVTNLVIKKAATTVHGAGNFDLLPEGTLELANKTSEATGRMARGWQASREAIQANADALDELNMRYKLSADYTEREIALLARQAAALEKAAEAKRKYWNVDKDGFTLDANGHRQQMTAPTGEFVFNAAKGAGLTEAEALALMDKYFQNGKPTGVTAANGLNGPSRDWFSIVNDAISQAVIEKARQNVAGGGAQNSNQPVAQGGGDGAGGSSGARTEATSAKSSGVTYVANITIPGLAGTTTLRYADAESQSKGEDLLRKLAQAKGASI